MASNMEDMIYEKEHRIKMKNILVDLCSHQSIEVADYNDDGRFKRWVEYSVEEYYDRYHSIQKGLWFGIDITKSSPLYK